MLKGSQLKKYDTFYYVSLVYNNDGIKQYIVMPYKFDKRLHYCFDEKLMFATEKEANRKADELNKQLKQITKEN